MEYQNGVSENGLHKNGLHEKVVLAYSGGLDTSCILVWLIEKGYDVICFLADVGQDEDFEAARQKAYMLGASKIYVEDLKTELVEEFVWPAVQANAIYEHRYMLGTAIARPCVARRQVEIAKKEGARYVSHGATGKGNDQIRFELAYYVLCPGLKVIAPWMIPEFYETYQGRKDLFNYAAKRNIPLSVTPKEPWSMDENLIHISYNSGVLEDADCAPPNNIYQKTVDPMDAPDKPEEIIIGFKKGVPVSVKNTLTGVEHTKPYHIYKYLNEIGSKHSIGRIDMVENAIHGTKVRSLYETPGGEILRHAHLDIEAFTMDKELQKIKSYLSGRFSEMIYDGLWFSPECDFTRKCIDDSQKDVGGKVTLSLYKGRVYVNGRESASSLYNKDFVSMDAQGSWQPKDSDGFVKYSSLRLSEYARLQKRLQKFQHV